MAFLVSEADRATEGSDMAAGWLGGALPAGIHSTGRTRGTGAAGSSLSALSPALGTSGQSAWTPRHCWGESKVRRRGKNRLNLLHGPQRGQQQVNLVLDQGVIYESANTTP